MKRTPLFAGLGSIAVGVVLTVTPIFPLGVLFFLMGIVLCGIAAMPKKEVAQGNRDWVSEVHNEDRVFIRPLQRLRNEIVEVVTTKSKSSTTMKALGPEAVTEAEAILEQAVKLVNLRRSVKAEVKSEYEADQAISKILEALTSATTDSERANLESALAARKMEKEGYTRLRDMIPDVEGSLSQAEAALAQTKLQLTNLESKGDSATDAVSELSDTLNRLQALSTSVEEAELFVSGEIK